MRLDVQRGPPQVAATAFVRPRASVCGAVSLGDGVSIWGGAVLRGDTEQITIGAILLNGSRIGTGSIVGAGALVREGQQVPPGSLVVGVPARLVRPTTEAERATLGRTSVRYQALAAAHRDGVVLYHTDV